MFLKKTILIIALLLAVETPAHSWFWDKPAAELLQEALRSDDPGKVDECLDHQIKQQKYIAIFRLKNHALLMLRKERGRINGIPGSSSADIAKQLEPWKKIIEKADSVTKAKKPFAQPAGRK